MQTTKKSVTFFFSRKCHVIDEKNTYINNRVRIVDYNRFVSRTIDEQCFVDFLLYFAGQR